MNNEPSVSVIEIKKAVNDIINELKSVEYHTEQVCIKRVDFTDFNIMVMSEEIALYKLLLKLNIV